MSWKEKSRGVCALGCGFKVNHVFIHVFVMFLMFTNKIPWHRLLFWCTFRVNHHVYILYIKDIPSERVSSTFSNQSLNKTLDILVLSHVVTPRRLAGTLKTYWRINRCRSARNSLYWAAGGNVKLISNTENLQIWANEKIIKENGRISNLLIYHFQPWRHMYISLTLTRIYDFKVFNKLCTYVLFLVIRKDYG